MGQPASYWMGPFLAVVPTAQAGMDPRRKEEKKSMSSRTPAAKPGHASPSGLMSHCLQGAPAGWPVSPCLHSLPVLEPLSASDLGTRADP